MALVGLLRLGMLVFLGITGIFMCFKLFRKMRLVNQGWKKAEPHYRKFVEEQTGQKIRETMILNASASGDFERDSTMIWFAFTADKVGFIPKDSVLDKEGAAVVLLDKSSVSFQRTHFRIYKMKKDTKEDPGTDNLLFVAIPKKRMENLRHHIRRIQHTK